jgi:hypothetical protein
MGKPAEQHRGVELLLPTLLNLKPVPGQLFELAALIESLHTVIDSPGSTDQTLTRLTTALEITAERLEETIRELLAIVTTSGSRK